MGLFAWLKGQPAWAWQPGWGPPTVDTVRACAEALSRAGARAAAERKAVLQQLAALLDPEAQQQGLEAAAAVAEALATEHLLNAAALAVLPDAQPSEAAIEAAASFATRVAAASSAAAAALGASGLVGSLAALLEAPSTQVSPDAKLDVLEFFRRAAARAHVRDAMEEEGAPAAVVAALHAAVEAADWPLAGDAAWALELMAGHSRRLTSGIGEAGGVEAALQLLRAARQQQPAVRELPRDEDAAEAAGAALHALLVLLTDHRRNRGRLVRAGGAAELVAALRDEALPWESREQAASLLQDLAAALLQDAAAEDGGAAAAAAAPTPSSAPRPPPPPAEQSQEGLWRVALLPALVAALQQRRGAALAESKEAAAGVLARFAANGPRFAAAVGEAGALQPLVHLLAAGLRLAGGERRAAIAALAALEPLAAEAGCQEEVLEDCVRGSGSLDVLGLLKRALAEATAPELSLSRYDLRRGGGGSAARDGGQLVAAGWHASAVAARLCGGRQQRLADAAVTRGLLPPLAAFVCTAPAPPSRGAAAAAGGGRAVDYQQAVRCEVAGLLRSLSMRHRHHAALRAAPGLLSCLHSLLLPGAPGWTELKAAAKKVLQHLGELPDTDRPLLTYTPQQLGALLEQQGLEAARFVERGVTGAAFVRLGDGEVRELAAAGQAPRVLRVLRAYETFSDIDAYGARSGTLSLAKLLDWLGARGHRTAEVVPLAESLMELMDGDRDDAASFPDFLQCYDEFLARTLADVQPPSKRQRTGSFRV